MGEMRYAYTNLVRKSEWNGPLEELGIDGRIILERILGKWDGRLWTGYISLRIRTTDGFLLTWCYI
jgi:hypothetical protein